MIQNVESVVGGYQMPPEGWSNEKPVDGLQHRLAIIDSVMREAGERCRVSVQDVLSDPPNERTTDDPPWRLRVRVVSVPTDPVPGETALYFYHRIRAALFEVQRAVGLTWSTGEWAVLGFDVSRTSKKLRAPVLEGDPGAFNVFDNKPNPQRYRMDWRNVDMLTVAVVLVDQMRSDEEDPYYERTGRDGPMRRYIKTGAWRALPASLRNQMEHALQVLGTTQERKEQQPVSAGVAAPSDEQLALIRKMRGAGVAWRDISGLLGMDWRAVRDAVEDGAEAVDNPLDMEE